MWGVSRRRRLSAVSDGPREGRETKLQTAGVWRSGRDDARVLSCVRTRRLQQGLMTIDNGVSHTHWGETNRSASMRCGCPRIIAPWRASLQSRMGRGGDVARGRRLA